MKRLGLYSSLFPYLKLSYGDFAMIKEQTKN